MDDEKKVMQEQINSLNEEIRDLAYKLRGLLDVDCNMGVCSYNPDADDLQEKMREVQKKKELLERIRINLDSCKLD